MKRIILIPLLAFLTGCVTHHHHYIQESEADGAAYYSDSTPEYAENTSQVQVYTDYSSDYSSARYYPWWSVDYFYLSPYRRHSGGSVGFNVGFGSAWYDPFYWAYEPYSIAYSPFYYSYFYAPYWRNDYRYGHYNRYSYYNNYWRYRYNHFHGSRHRNHDAWQRDRLARGHDEYGDYNDRDRHAGSFDNRRGRREDGRIVPVDRGGDRSPGGQNQPRREPGVNRHVSVAPGANSGERGMEVRNRQARKPVETRIEPDKRIRKLSPADGVAVVTPRPEDRVYKSVQKNGSEVRSYAGNKKAATKPEPVTPAPRIVQDRSMAAGKVQTDKYRQVYPVTQGTNQGKARPVKTRPVQPQPSGSGGNDIRTFGSGGYTTSTGPVIRVEPPRQARQDKPISASSRQARPAARPVYQQAPQRAVSARPSPAQSRPVPHVSVPAPSRQVRPQAAGPQSKAPPRAANAKESSREGKQRSGKRDER